MKFKTVQILIQSEGEILTLVERIDDPNREQLYIEGKVLQCRCKLICKTNVDLIEMFLLGRISVRDLFKLRSDEPYIIELNQHRQEKIVYDDTFERCILSSLESGNKHLYQLSPNMRIKDPFEFLRILKRDYIHSFGSVPLTENNLSGQSFITRHPEFFE